MAAPGMALPRTPLAGRSAVPARLGLRLLLFVILLAPVGFARIVWAEPQQQVVLPPAAEAEAAGWAVVALSGPVVFRTGDRREWRTLSRSQILTPDFEVITGAGGFVKLVRAHDQVAIEENAHLVFPASDPLKEETSIFQLIGSAFFEVTKRQRWNFEVKTPFLAAVVKGTSFEVSVARSGADVEVVTGLVGVSTDGGGGKDVSPGQTASVAAGSRDLAVGPTSSGPAPATPAASVSDDEADEATDRPSSSDSGFAGGQVDRSDRGNGGTSRGSSAGGMSGKGRDYRGVGRGDKKDGGGVSGDDDDGGDDSDDDD